MVIHPSTQNSYQTALAMQEKGWLDEFVTGFYAKRWRMVEWALRLLPKRYRALIEKELERRRMPGLPDEKVRLIPFEDLIFVLFSRVKILEGIGGFFPIHRWRMNQFYRKAAKRIRVRKPDVVVVYDTCGAEILKAAKAVGAITILDQTIGHVLTAISEHEKYDVPLYIPDW